MVPFNLICLSELDFDFFYDLCKFSMGRLEILAAGIYFHFDKKKMEILLLLYIVISYTISSISYEILTCFSIYVVKYLCGSILKVVLC